ncbi:MAG: chemotaxis protein CheA [Pirellulaceae bacterium]
MTTIKDSVRVDRERLDNLINQIGELVIGTSMVEQEFYRENPDRESSALNQLGKVVRDLQEMSLSLRMVPIDATFQKMARLVRDLSKKLNKKIRFETEGEKSELDKTVVDQIGDPLLHMIRNSVDHGIETTEERIAAGKSEEGRVCLRAFHQGGNFIIEIEDDGRGLNRDRIMKKAIERGLISEGDKLSDEEINGLIFQPGFSTAAEVTDVSGRGVGMDVVRRNVESLQGSISIRSKPGKGCLVTIRLPLTLAILDGLIIRSAQEVFVIPLLSVVESICPGKNDIKRILGKGEVIKLRGEVVPLLRLNSLLAMSEEDLGFVNPNLLVIVEDQGRKFAISVDELVGQQQVVIKNLETNFQKVPGVAGATILGDGRVALILDINGLNHINLRTTRSQPSLQRESTLSSAEQSCPTYTETDKENSCE